jgi:hypothetical protein
MFGPQEQTFYFAARDGAQTLAKLPECGRVLDARTVLCGRAAYTHRGELWRVKARAHMGRMIEIAAAARAAGAIPDPMAHLRK